MYLVGIHSEYGVVVAPKELTDIDGAAVDVLHGRGFRWNDDEEVFAVPVENRDEKAAEDFALCTAVALLLTGHNVIVSSD